MSQDDALIWLRWPSSVYQLYVYSAENDEKRAAWRRHLDQADHRAAVRARVAHYADFPTLGQLADAVH